MTEERLTVHLTAQEAYDATSGPEPIGLQEAARRKLEKLKATRATFGEKAE